jgi:hypothetical protein
MEEYKGYQKASDELEKRMFSEELLNVSGSIEAGDQIWLENDRLKKHSMNIEGFWVTCPESLFQWQKLSDLGFLPLLAFIFGLKRVSVSFNVFGKFNGFDYAQDYKAGAKVIDIVQLVSSAHIYGDSHADKICDVYASFELIDGKFEWIYKTSDPVGELTRHEWEEDKEYTARLAKQTRLKDWWNKSHFSFNRGAFRIAHYLQLTAQRGDLELTGRPHSAIADRVPLDPDWFASEIRFDPDRTSIWIGETRIWNVEVRLAKSVLPAGLSMNDDGSTQPERGGASVIMMNSEGEARLAGYVVDYRSKKGRSPTRMEMEAQGSLWGYNRSSVREAIGRLPADLRNAPGRPKKS